MPLPLVATLDVDAFGNLEYEVRRKLDELLKAEGFVLDPVAHEAWMPAETRYEPFFRGEYIDVLSADAEAILLSKAKMAPEKNRALLIAYLANGPSPHFFTLAQKYGVRLEDLLWR